MGAIGDEVVQIAVVVALGVLLPLPVVVDALELADEEAQGKEAREKPRVELALELDPPGPVTRATLLEGGAPLILTRVWLSTSVALSLLKCSF